MKELEIYTKALKVVESCTNYDHILSAIKFVDQLENQFSDDMYIIELRGLIKSRGNLLVVK